MNPRGKEVKQNIGFFPELRNFPMLAVHRVGSDCSFMGKQPPQFGSTPTSWQEEVSRKGAKTQRNLKSNCSPLLGFLQGRELY